MPESLSLRGMNGLKAVSCTSPGKALVKEVQLGQRELAAEVDAVKVGQAGQILAARAPAKRIELGRVDFALIGRLQVAVQDAGIEQTALRRSALMAKWEKPLTLPLLGRLKISQSMSRPLPARPMQPVPMPPSGKLIWLVLLPW